MSVMRWVYRWVFPDAAARAIGHVGWRLADGRDELRALGGLISATFDVPWDFLSPVPIDWRPWPMAQDFLPRVRRASDPYYRYEI